MAEGTPVWMVYFLSYRYIFVDDGHETTRAEELGRILFRTSHISATLSLDAEKKFMKDIHNYVTILFQCNSQNPPF